MLKRFPEYGRKPPETPPFLDTLRRLIVGRIHAGLLSPGDRLPSVREVANRSRVDHRVASRAYRVLEEEGLVEVRSKSGVYVSTSLEVSPAGAEGAAWAADILFEAWQRGIPRSSLCGLFGGMLPSPLRCGCIESNEDHLVAFAAEIEEALSLEVVPMLVDPSADEGAPAPEEVGEVDVIATSIFHARYARAVGAAAGKPVAVLNLRAEFAAEVARRLAGGAVTAVMADPRYAGRGREFFKAAGYRLDARFLSVEEAVAEGLDLNDDSVLATRAARRRLGLPDYHLVPSPRLVSDESARALCEIVAAAAPHRRARLRLSPPEPPVPAASRPTAMPGQREREENPIERTVREVERALRDGGIFEALRVLNATTPHRFTAIYRFEPGWVRSVVLFDRENPHLRIGADVPMKESYCVLAADDGDGYLIEDALADSRLEGHAARAAVLCYCAVHLRDSDGASWGTLCHYDFHPAPISEETLATLRAVQPVIERTLPPAAPYECTLPDCVAEAPSAPERRSRPRERAGAPPPRRKHPARDPGLASEKLPPPGR